AALGALALANLDERIPSGPRPARNRVAMARFQGELSDKMVVKSVEDGGLAKMFGLMKGDKLLALDGSKLANEPGKFRRTLRDLLRSGKTMLELQVRRKGKKIMLKLNASRRGKDEAKPTGPKRRRR
ncbi:MAG: hypothetical protein CMJ85_01625, partial [Planctomycetes bacterium]|nr:hypothetical protein [Planctomycetota bacterium]